MGMKACVALLNGGSLFHFGKISLNLYRSSPVQVGTSSFSTISSGPYIKTCLATNALFSWIPDTTNGPGPTLIDSYASSGIPELLKSSPTLTGSINAWSKLGVGNKSMMLIKTNGLLFGVGRNRTGSLGNGNATIEHVSSPIQIGSSSWSAISHEEFVSAGISNSKLFTWGSNSLGQLGLNNGTNYSSPMQVGSSNWNAVNVGRFGYHLMAIRSDGLLFTWGANGQGELGDGTTVNKSSPVQIGALSWSQIAGAKFNSMAVRSDGLLFTWGYNFRGQLGDGTTVKKSSPVQIGSSSWLNVSCAYYSSAAIRLDGALFTWGYGIFGVLGLNNTTTYSSPVQVGSSSWTAVSLGKFNAAAIRSDGALFVWGKGSGGRIGDGTIIDKSSPVQIGSSSWVAVGGSDEYWAAIKF